MRVGGRNWRWKDSWEGQSRNWKSGEEEMEKEKAKTISVGGGGGGEGGGKEGDEKC